MADRKQTPDILGSLLGDTQPETPKKPVYQNTIKPEYHKDSKPVRQPTSKPVSHKKPKDQDTPGEKVKATYYISSQAVEALETGWIQLRRLASKKTRGQISKSLIVELALQMALEDLDSKGSSSQIAKRSL